VAQPDRVDGEEVAGENRFTVRSEEAALRLRVVRRGRQAGVGEDVSTEVAETVMPSLRKFASDPQVAPA
jgi:hypothetical protein